MARQDAAHEALGRRSPREAPHGKWILDAMRANTSRTEVVSPEVLLPIRSLSLQPQLADRVSHLLRAAGVDERITAIGHPSELLLHHLPSPESFPAGLRRYMEQWFDDLTSLLAALPPLADQGRLKTGLEGLTQLYPVLACLDTRPPSKHLDEAQGLKGLLVLASLLPLAYDCDLERLQKATPRVAAHIRLACSGGGLGKQRPLDIWPSKACTVDYIRRLRDIPRPQGLTRQASEMHREVTRLAWKVSTVVFLRVPRDFRGYKGVHQIAPDEEPSDEVFWEEADGAYEPDVEPVLVVKEGEEAGYAERPADLEPAAKRARWLSGEYQAPALWSSSTVTPIELQRLTELLGTLDYAGLTALVLALQVATGRPVKAVLSMTIGHGADLTPDGVYCKSVPADPTQEVEPQQRILLDLPLPRPLGMRVAELAAVQVSTPTLREVYAVDDDSTITRQVGVLLRERVSGRLEARHLPGVIRGMLHRASNDVVAYLLAGTDAYIPPVGASYYGCTSRELVARYRNVVEPLFVARQGGRA